MICLSWESCSVTSMRELSKIFCVALSEIAIQAVNRSGKRRFPCPSCILMLTRFATRPLASSLSSTRLRRWDLGFRVQGLGFRVQGLGFRVSVGKMLGPEFASLAPYDLRARQSGGYDKDSAFVRIRSAKPAGFLQRFI